MNEHEEYIRETISKIKDSNLFLGILTENYIKSGKAALEIGTAVLLDKPIKLLVREGTIIPLNLRRLAQRIEYFKADDDIGIVAQRLLEDK